MKSKKAFTKRDLVMILGSTIFLLANLGAIGGSGRRRAKEAVCLSNLRQWGNVFSMYLGDNEGIFMRGWAPATSSPKPHKDYWMEALRPYYGNNHKLRCCPEAVIPGTEVGQGPWGGVQPDATFYAWGVFAGECGQPSPSWSWVVACDYGSYGINGYVQNPPLSAGTYQGHDPKWNWRIANVTGADSITLFLGAQWVDAWPHHTNDPPAFQGDSVNRTKDMIKRVCLNRHNGFVNSAFLDFSARKVGLKELWKLKWHRAFDTNAGPTPDEFDMLAPWMQDFQDY
ncbi:MAG: hypothetical protein ACYS0C_02875 [Planctomycetota bacterium]|jgi:hypothetical protein